MIRCSFAPGQSRDWKPKSCRKFIKSWCFLLPRSGCIEGVNSNFSEYFLLLFEANCGPVIGSICPCCVRFCPPGKFAQFDPLFSTIDPSAIGRLCLLDAISSKRKMIQFNPWFPTHDFPRILLENDEIWLFFSSNWSGFFWWLNCSHFGHKWARNIPISMIANAWFLCGYFWLFGSQFRVWNGGRLPLLDAISSE